MMNLPDDDQRAVAIVAAIRGGNVDALQRQLGHAPELGAARVVDGRGVSRTWLHVAADWPGHFPNGRRTVATLIAAGAEVDAALMHRDEKGPAETAAHWAASSDDVDVLDALLDGGADIEAPGAVLTGGTPLSAAVVFAQWRAARRLLERGATTTIWQAAALGLLDRVQGCFAHGTPPAEDQITNAFWHACRGGQREVAEYLLDRGADMNWVGYDRKTPLDVATDAGANDLVQWLHARGARRAAELG